MSAREVIREIVDYNKPLLLHPVPPHEGPGELTAQALRRKLDALCATPFQFFRGTFHLMAWDLFHARVPHAEALAPEGLIVGDLHLENFGIYRGQSGELCFDVNDFDDVGYGPIDLDLKRLCTSALLLPGLSPGLRLGAAKTIARGWAEELIKQGGRFPIPPWDASKAEGRAGTLLEGRKQRAREDFIGKVAPEHGQKRLAQNEKFARLNAHWTEIVHKSVKEYFANLEQLKAPNVPSHYEIHDVAYRFKGLGSLGRLRFTALIGKGSERRLFELKEARNSAMDDARGRKLHDRGRVQTASIRRLQADPWPRVAATSFGNILGLGRENEPEEEKVGSELFASDHAELGVYARQCGQVLARLHVRENAPAILGSDWDIDKCQHAAVQFAGQYAAQVESDQKLLAVKKAEVTHQLGV